MAKAAAQRERLEQALILLRRLSPEMETSHGRISIAYQQQEAFGTQDKNRRALEEHGLTIAQAGRVQIQTMLELENWLQAKIAQLIELEQAKQEAIRKISSSRCN